MVDAVVAVALKTVSDLLVAEGKFLFGVRDKVEELRGELEALESFLKEANARKHEDQRLRTCVNQAKHLAYRAEDTIEEYAIKVASTRGWGFTKVARRVGGIMGEGIATHKVGNEIGKIKTEIANLIKRLEGYGINRIIEAQPSSATIEKQRRLRTTYAHEVDEYCVGKEDDISKILTWVTEDNKTRRVISICGVGGLAKTTTARKIYNHRLVQSSFECFAWVSLTQQYQVQMILQNILIQILGYESRNNVSDTKEDQKIIGNEGRVKGDMVRDMKEEELVPMLYDMLKNKKYFVVLDDIWKMDDWESLRPAFPISEGRSKILLTTRIKEVAAVAHRHSQHEPTLLDEKNGWDLLTKIVFNLQEDKANELSKTIENVGRHMLRKCGGLPLAIATLGGILRNKDPLSEWEIVNKKFGAYMSGNSGILNVLAFSYHDLPSYLKPCFLYMGCFREDEEIDVMRLYQLWMAEGLIPSSRQGLGESFMDVGSDFLDELISRNMVQPPVKNVFTDEKSCKLHDLMRELCLTKGREEQFLKGIQIGDGKVGTICFDDGPDFYRHAIFIETQVENMIGIEKSRNDEYFRALIFNSNNHRQKICVQGVMRFKRLRSLILDHCEFMDKKLPKEIRDIIHLRYLSLQYSLSNGILPAFIGDLQYLQTLNLANNEDLGIPNIFHKMKRLRCLYLPHFRQHSIFSRELEFHGLNELEVVEGWESISDDFTHLSELVNLRRFSARILRYEDLYTILAGLTSLLKVQYISITFGVDPISRLKVEKRFPDVKKLLLYFHLHNLELIQPIGNFPEYEPQFWPDLVYLELYNTKFEEDPMPFLQELPNLKKLTMNKDAYDGKEMYCSSKAFPKLTSLEISWVHSIEIWRVDAGAFPNLSTLLIWRCSSFEIVPHGFTNITTLTRIDIYEMPEEFRNKYGRLQNTKHSLLPK